MSNIDMINILGGIGVIGLIGSVIIKIIMCIVVCASVCMILKKFGSDWWKGLIPVYNIVELNKCIGNKNIVTVAFIVSITMAITGYNIGRDIGFITYVIGLISAVNIYYYISITMCNKVHASEIKYVIALMFPFIGWCTLINYNMNKDIINKKDNSESVVEVVSDVKTLI